MSGVSCVGGVETQVADDKDAPPALPGACGGLVCRDGAKKLQFGKYEMAKGCGADDNATVACDGKGKCLSLLHCASGSECVSGVCTDGYCVNDLYGMCQSAEDCVEGLECSFKLPNGICTQSVGSQKFRCSSDDECLSKLCDLEKRTCKKCSSKPSELVPCNDGKVCGAGDGICHTLCTLDPDTCAFGETCVQIFGTTDSGCYLHDPCTTSADCNGAGPPTKKCVFKSYCVPADF